MEHFRSQTVSGIVDAATAEGRPDQWDLETLWAELGRLFPVSLTADEIVLEREGDDLLVSAGRHTRATRLSPLHRRCVVTDARMRSGILTIALEPDAGQWPR